ncbi:MAG TPA: grasp-with-spasm system ATP-grasp peptide maturase [Bacteroidia bacterium]|nr:grasp-with-spasm system ATP-grasp peptide maturase [Bacteroidia bacterium]
MILIISDERDASTNGVIAWIEYFGYKWIRINANTEIQFSDLNFSSNENVKFRLKKKNSNWIELDDIKSVWYRRGGIYPSNLKVNINTFNDGMAKTISAQLKREGSSLMEFIYTLLSEKPSIGSFYSAEVNKLTALHNAKVIGFQIPSTLITTSKKSLREFEIENGKLISKSIGEALYLELDSDFYCNYTEIIEEEFVNNLQSHFFPSLVQQKLDKAYELRIFYLYGKCHTMAIFSQGDSQTEVDFRKYNDYKPNRTIPYSLPLEIQLKINAFMKAMGLNTGSIDIVVTKTKEYVFLEVNPVGQFGMVSGPCNFNLEREIANCLIDLGLNLGS